MNLIEFKNEFDFLYQSAINVAPDMNSYEISLCLTKAVDKLILEAITNVDTNEGSRRLLHPLRVDTGCTVTEVTSENKKFKKLKVYFPKELQYNLRYSINAFGCSGYLETKYTKIDYINEDFSNPFRSPNKRKALIVSGGEDSDGRYDYIYVAKDVNVMAVSVDYIKYNKPIIIEDFADGIDTIGDESIKGFNTKTETELTQEFHSVIVETAVSIAKQTLKY